MDEALVQAVTDRIWAAWGDGRPPALLLGRAPEEDLGYRYVQEPPYEAVVMGSLTPGQLLCFREERVLEALLGGTPVYLYTPGLPGKQGKNRALQARLTAAQRELKAWGVVFLDGPAHRRLVSAEEARRLKAQGRPPTPGAVRTPLAREILEQP